MLGYPVAMLHAATATAWELNTYLDFSKGRLENLSLTRDGRLVLAPKLDPLSTPGQSVIWSAAAAPGGSLYFGASDGKLYRCDATGKSEVVWTAPQAQIFAIAADSAGRVYAAASPGGAIYRIEGGKASLYYETRQGFVWSLSVGRDSALYAGTGPQGKVYRISGVNQGEVYYESGQTHVTSLAFDAQGRLLAGTEPNGILYRIAAKGQGFVLYDANFPEIRSIVAAPDGSIYAAAMGGSAAKQATAASSGTPAPAAGTTPTVTTTITVTDADAAQSGPDIKPKPPGQQQPQQQQSQQQQQQSATTATSAVIEYPGAERSAIFRIHPDHTVEQIWVSKDENAYDIAAVPGGIYAATDNQGRVYRITPDRKVALIAETRETEVTRMVALPGSLILATGESGRVFRLGNTIAASGTFESPVHDATAVARWGRLSWRADGPVRFRTRSGNSARPDKTWSEWSATVEDPAGSQVTSPNARYVQWKAEFAGAGTVSPSLDSVRLAYLPQNTAPVVKTLNVAAQAIATAAAKPAVTAPTAAYSITVTDTGDAGTTSTAGTLTQPVTRAAQEQMIVSWTAEDPDSDKLTYALHFRGEGETAWKPLRLNFHETNHMLDAEALADGRYFFRVTASDKAANPGDQAREAELVSPPVLVDRTPPVVSIAAPSRNGTAIELRVEAADAGSPLRGAEYSIDAGPWMPLAAADGVTDSMKESFVILLDPAPAGEHLVVVRAFDSGNNAAVAKTVLR